MPWSTCSSCRKGYYHRRTAKGITLTHCASCRPRRPRKPEVRIYYDKHAAPMDEDAIAAPAQGLTILDERGREVNSLELARRYQAELL